MKKNIIKMLALMATIATTMTACAGCKGCNGSEKQTGTTPTVTTEPTEPTVAPTTAPTATPEPEASVTPDILPTPIPPPTAIPTPEPTATPEPTPTPTPAPTATPTPVITVDKNAKLLDSVKMGDNVFYDFYDDGTLVVRGKGATKGFDKSIAMLDEIARNSKVSEVRDCANFVTSIVIEEGITVLGKYSLGLFRNATGIVFPNSLVQIKDLALVCIGEYAEEIDYIGLDLTKVKVAGNSFWKCGNPEKVEGLDKYTAMPTLAPTPTPTPLPNPDKPRMLSSKKMGDNVTFEFWDNGYLYVKGTGATYDYDWDFVLVEGKQYSTIHNVIVEEGITYLGDNTFHSFDMDELTYWSLPRTLTAVGNIAGGGMGITIEGYYEGRAVTIKSPGAAGPNALFGVMSDMDKYLAKGWEITYK